MASYPNINGVAYDHSSCRIRVDGLPERRVDDLSYAHGMNGVNKLHGTSVQPIARTRGQYVPDAPSITLHREAWHELRTRFGAGYMERVFDIIVEYQEAGQGFVKDTIKGCKITKVENTTSQGGAALVTKLTLDCMYVLENGVAPVANFSR